MTNTAPDLDAGLELLAGGTAAYGRMLALIDAARESVDLETYIFTADTVGAGFRAALVAAAARGVRVRVLVDAYGSEALPADWFEPLRAAGGEWRWFNPRRLLRLSFRNHRKSLRCDGSAVIGGLNIADEYDGDGIARGWRDFAVAFDHPPLLAALAASFERMWALAPFGRAEVRAFWRGRPPRPAAAVEPAGPVLLTSGAGCRGALLRRRLRLDLLAGRHSLAWVAYFLPSQRLGRAIRAAARRGRVEILLGARTDVPLARWASERQFAALLRAGVRLHEYQPQVVHAKIVVADDIVYVGSANLDVRSLQINYELLLRLSAPRLAARLRAEFAADIARSAPLELRTWQAGRRWWHGLRSWLACQLLGRLDPFVARRKLRSLG